MSIYFIKYLYFEIFRYVIISIITFFSCFILYFISLSAITDLLPTRGEEAAIVSQSDRKLPIKLRDGNDTNEQIHQLIIYNIMYYIFIERYGGKEYKNFTFSNIDVVDDDNDDEETN